MKKFLKNKSKSQIRKSCAAAILKERGAPTCPFPSAMVAVTAKTNPVLSNAACGVPAAFAGNSS